MINKIIIIKFLQLVLKILMNSVNKKNNQKNCYNLEELLIIIFSLKNLKNKYEYNLKIKCIDIKLNKEDFLTIFLKNYKNLDFLMKN